MFSPPSMGPCLPLVHIHPPRKLFQDQLITQLTRARPVAVRGSEIVGVLTVDHVRVFQCVEFVRRRLVGDQDTGVVVFGTL